jgi:hypothetical protein
MLDVYMARLESALGGSAEGVPVRRYVSAEDAVLDYLARRQRLEYCAGIDYGAMTGAGRSAARIGRSRIKLGQRMVDGLDVLLPLHAVFEEAEATAHRRKLERKWGAWCATRVHATSFADVGKMLGITKDKVAGWVRDIDALVEQILAEREMIITGRAKAVYDKARNKGQWV